MAIDIEFGQHNVNGLQFDGLPADNFERVLGASGWRVDYVGTSTYVGIFRPETLDFMVNMPSSNPDVAARFEPLRERLKVLGPLLDNHTVHFPIWAVAATRLDWPADDAGRYGAGGGGTPPAALGAPPSREVARGRGGQFSEARNSA